MKRTYVFLACALAALIALIAIRPFPMICDIFGFVVGLAYAAWILSFVVSGVRTGRIHHTDSTSTYSFRKEPFRFTFVAVFFLLIGAVAVYCAVGRALAIWERLAA